MHSGIGASREKSRGVILYDVLIGTAVLGIAVMGVLATIPSTNQLEHNLSARETGHAELQQVWEDLYSLGAAEAFARYNAYDSDDPDGPGTAEGPTFNVHGLSPLTSHPAVGRIEFPPHTQLVPGGPIYIAENTVDEVLGMPRDLDGDGTVSSGVEASRIGLLPARIVMEWQGAGGEQVLQGVLFLGPR